MKSVKRVLVLVSDPNEVGIELQRAAQIAKTSNAQLHCLALLASPLFAIDAAWEKEDEVKLIDQITQQVAILTKGEIECIVHLGRDEPPESIDYTAGEIDADLLVLGVHDRSATDEAFAAQIAQSLYRPVLIVKNSTHGGYDRVIASTDLSKASAATVNLAKNTFSPTTLSLLYFYEDDDIEMEFVELDNGDSDADGELFGQNPIHEFAESVEVKRMEVVRSAPPFCETFLDWIREGKYGLAVVGTENVGIEGWYLGLEVENLLDRSKADILLYFNSDQ